MIPIMKRHTLFKYIKCFSLKKISSKKKNSLKIVVYHLTHTTFASSEILNPVNRPPKNPKIFHVYMRIFKVCITTTLERFYYTFPLIQQILQLIHKNRTTDLSWPMLSLLPCKREVWQDTQHPPSQFRRAFRSTEKCLSGS